MSEHDDVERLLTRYRPSGPRASLRQRVVAGGRPTRQRVSPRLTWLAAAAALVIVATAAALHTQASRTFDSLVAARFESAAQLRAVAIDEMTALLGGGDFARRAAEQWFEASQTIAATAASSSINLETIWIQ